MQFVTKNSSLIDFNIMYGNKIVSNTCNIKFLGVTLDDTFLENSYRKIPLYLN
jgi:hypothetical protein